MFCNLLVLLNMLNIKSIFPMSLESGKTVLVTCEGNLTKYSWYNNGLHDGLFVICRTPNFFGRATCLAKPFISQGNIDVQVIDLQSTVKLRHQVLNKQGSYLLHKIRNLEVRKTGKDPFTLPSRTSLFRVSPLPCLVWGFRPSACYRAAYKMAAPQFKTHLCPRLKRRQQQRAKRCVPVETASDYSGFLDSHLSTSLRSHWSELCHVAAQNHKGSWVWPVLFFRRKVTVRSENGLMGNNTCESSRKPS